jgi:hypothetical protein
VNGVVLVTHDVNSSWSLELKPSADTVPEFVEVTSEQGVCLLAMPIGAVPPEAPPEIRQETELSRGRRIEARLQFTNVGPLLEIAYHDPLLADDTEYAEESTEADAEIAGEPPAGFPTQPAEREKPPEITPRRSWWWRLWERVPKIAFPEMSPALATAMVFAVALAVIAVFWFRSTSTPSAAGLLARAAASNSEGATDAKPGVIRQKIRIRTSKRTLERTVYRDAQGLRHRKTEKLAPTDAQLKTRLALANVSWDEPLSAVNYQVWRDGQRALADEVKRSGDGLLTLTTTAPDGVVASESLTVRDRDFHPVERTVTFRNAETVDIVELDYGVLPWSPTTVPLFDALPGEISSDRPHPSVPLPLLTKAELDEAELQARLALNQLHADSDLRIEVLREPTGIRVNAIVETERRKRELEARLNPLPHVHASISTFDEMAVLPPVKPRPSRLKVYSSVGQPSPLEQHLTAAGWSRDRATGLSQQLLDSSITVGSESRALADLSQRFARDASSAASTETLLGRLIESHSTALLGALQEEETLLAVAGLESQPGSAPPSAELSLLEAAGRNRALCEQLALAGADSPSKTSAQSMAAETRQSIQQARAALSRTIAALSTSNRLNAER